MAEPTSTKPYLLRALYEWCVDNGYTPYVSVVVDASTRVPPEYVRNGEIVLNIGPLAANRLKLGNEQVEFSARFGGVRRRLELRGTVADVAVYDDFAHHPTAIATTLEGVRRIAGSGRVIADPSAGGKSSS